MNLELTAEQVALRNTVRRFLAEKASMATHVRPLLDDATGSTAQVWSGLAALGAVGVLIPEEFGGAGMTMVDAGIVAEELGAALHPGPWLSSAVAATRALSRTGADAGPLLAGIADGSTIATLGPLHGARPTAVESGDGVLLRGDLTALPDAAAADVLLVLAEGRDGLGLHAVDMASTGVAVTARTHVDQTTKLFDVGLDDAVAKRLGPVSTEVAQAIVDDVLIADAADALGAAQAVLTLAVDYAKVRGSSTSPSVVSRRSNTSASTCTRPSNSRAAGSSTRCGRRIGRTHRTTPRRVARQGLRGAAGHRRRHRDPGLRRHRLHLGARRAPLPQAAAGLQCDGRRIRPVSRGDRQAPRAVGERTSRNSESFPCPKCSAEYGSSNWRRGRTCPPRVRHWPTGVPTSSRSRTCTAVDPGRALVIGGFTKEAARAHVDFILEFGNRGKRSIAIDVKSDIGREYFGRLLATADVFLTNWLPGALERARLTVEDVRSFNPNIIIARGTGTGVRGPDRDNGGFDAATYLSRGGVAYTLTPFGTEHPAVQGPAFGDLQGGITLAGGLCAALFHRERTGEPSIVDSSLLAQAMWSIAPSISVADLFDIDGIPGAPPGLAMNPLVNRYKTRDGRHIQLVFLQPDRYWAGFCKRIGLPELATDPRFVPIEQSDRQRRRGVCAGCRRHRRPGSGALAQGARRRARRVGRAGDTEGNAQRSTGQAERLRGDQRRRAGQ